MPKSRLYRINRIHERIYFIIVSLSNFKSKRSKYAKFFNDKNETLRDLN